MDKLRLGIIGFSKGNGHPYSWSAIFNGYNPSAMQDCGFPNIIKYLKKQKFPEDSIIDAKVTHIWTEDNVIAKKIANASLINSIVPDYRDLLGRVDAILLARDDAENHIKFAMPFIRAGLPIYIDKPFALTLKNANLLLSSQKYSGQIFSCSALRYAKELMLSKEDLAAIGKIIKVEAFVPKCWEKYSVHGIEPTLLMLPNRGKIKSAYSSKVKNSVNLYVNYESGISIKIMNSGDTTGKIYFKIYGVKKTKTLIFKNTFDAFKLALLDFIYGIKNNQQRIKPDFLREVTKLIEIGHLEKNE